MLLPHLVFLIAKWLGILLGVGFVLALLAPKGNGFRDAWKYLIGVAIGAGLGFGLRFLVSDVFVVSRTESGMTAERMVLAFGKDYAFHDGSTLHMLTTDGRVLIVNDSPGALILRKVAYGKTQAEWESTLIRPLSITPSAVAIDYLGPAEEPPEESMGGTSGKLWLNWQ